MCIFTCVCMRACALRCVKFINPPPHTHTHTHMHTHTHLSGRMRCAEGVMGEGRLGCARGDLVGSARMELAEV
jgi:hypothetical protein